MENPYQAPASDVSVEPTGEARELATRGSRLLAAIVDTIITVLAIFPVMFFYGAFNLEDPEAFTAGDQLISSIIGMALFCLIHGFTLARSGQSLGKVVLGIQIVSNDDESLLPFPKLIGLRYLPIWVVSLIPVGGLLSLIDVLFIFREDRRCIHDMIAGTKVVKVAGK